MRIQFTNNGNTYTIETIKSFAKYLSQRFAKTKKSGQTEFVADFALTSYDDDCEVTIPKVLSDIRETGWFGVKELGEIGFNSDNRQLAFDYYGGSHLRVVDYDEGFMDQEDAERLIKNVLQDIFDVSYDTPLLLVQWTQDECLKKDTKEAAMVIQQFEVCEVCPDCGAENIMRWDVEKEGYVAYCSHCGSKMMLCDECLHSAKTPICDWNSCNGCHREHKKGKTILNSSK